MALNCVCGQPAVSDGLCRMHYIESREQLYLDNTEVSTDRGIIRWALDMLPEYLSESVPAFHLDIYRQMLSLFDPSLTNKYQRLLELISFRGSAKSTVINMIFPAYILAHNGMTMKLKTSKGEVIDAKIREGLIVIVSETAGSAEDFTVRIRDEFTTNERLRYFYSYTIEDAIDDVTGVWTRAAFKINKCFLLGLGTGQQIRGKVKGANRPTLLIADDLYSEKNTFTSDARAKVKRWWNAAVMNSIDDLRGKVVMCGTIVHEDTVLVDAERNEMWRTLKYTLCDPEEFRVFIKEHMELDRNKGVCKLKYDDVENMDERMELQRRYYDSIPLKSLAWPERQTPYFLAQKYKEALSNSSLSTFYQEYFHIVIQDDDKRFRADYFQQLGEFRVEYQYGYNWLYSPLYESGGIAIPQIVNIEFGIDISAGTDKGDDCVITVVGATSDKRRFVFHQAIQKMSIRDVLRDDSADYIRYGKVCMDRELLDRTGFIDEAFRLAQVWKPSKIKIGIAGEEKLYIDEFRRVFAENGDYTQIMPQLQSSKEGAKYERITNNMLPYYETRSVWHRAGLTRLEYQLEFLTKAKHDDAADSASVAFHGIEEPPKTDYAIFSQKQIASSSIKRYLWERKRAVNTYDWKTNSIIWIPILFSLIN